MIWKGVALSLCAAVTHTAIDTLRKSASATLSVSNLVCLVAILDALISCTFVAATGGFQDVTILDPKMFWMAVICSSTLLLLSKCLYQHALATSQLSLTVPYLSFTPTFLVATAYLFIGEEPTPLGLVGVSVVTAGGYLLSRQDQAGGAAGSKSDKDIALGLPTTRQGAHKRQASRDGPGGGSSFASWLGMESSPGPTKHHGDTLASPGENGISAQHGTEKTKHLETRLSSRSLQDLALPQTSLGVANSLNACKALASRPGRSGVAFVAPLELEPVSESSVNVQPVQIDKGSSAGYAMSGGGGPKVHGPGASSVRGWGCLRGWDSGTGIMMCVAGLWSITASLDKLGVMHAPTVWIYFAFQRLAIGVACAVYLLWSSPHAFKLLWTRNLRSLVLISLCETLAVVLFLEAIEYLFVSYVVAIKRCNILMSVVLGGLLWREKIMHRLPYILLMLVGMTLIVLDPDSSTVHTTSHS